MCWQHTLLLRRLADYYSLGIFSLQSEEKRKKNLKYILHLSFERAVRLDPDDVLAVIAGLPKHSSGLVVCRKC